MILLFSLSRFVNTKGVLFWCFLFFHFGEKKGGKAFRVWTLFEETRPRFDIKTNHRRALFVQRTLFSLSLSPNDDDDDEPRERRRTTLFDEKETALREERHVVEGGCDL